MNSTARLDAMAATADDVRVRLRSLGQRRRRLRTREEELSDEVTQALREAVDVISVAEASRLLGIHRTTVYRVYHPHEQ